MINKKEKHRKVFGGQDFRGTFTAGQALIIAVIFFVAVSALIVFGISSPLIRASVAANAFADSKESFYLSEAGLEDAFYRLKTGKEISTSENIPLNSHFVPVEINDLSGNRKEVIATGAVSSRVRKGRMVLDVGEGATFNFGVQTDTGGILMENSSSVNGNAFSNGTIEGSGNNLINGDAISAGPSGLLEGIHTVGDGYANVIRNTTIDGDAYYQTISNTTVGGVSNPDSPDQATSSLPITDEQIDALESDAEAGGVTECTEELVINSNATIGPQKYTCDVRFRNNPVITLEGSIWVEGNIKIENSATFVVGSSLASEGESVPIIADNPADILSSGRIIISNSGFFDGGSNGSYITLISQNESEERGGTESAIEINNGAQGDVLVYAAHGRILLKNNVDLKEVTAYRVHLQNSAEVTYETGLVNVNFTSGPGASFNLDLWEEIE